MLRAGVFFRKKEARRVQGQASTMSVNFQLVLDLSQWP